MYEVIYMKADYEPWWMFEGWEEMIRFTTHIRRCNTSTGIL